MEAAEMMSAIPEIAPAPEALEVPAPDAALPAVVELLIRDRDAADAALSDPARARALMAPMAAVTAGGLAAFAGIQGALVTSPGWGVWPAPLSASDPVTAGVAIFLAYAAGLFGAQVAGLPTFYFQALMARLPTHAWQIAAESLRASATAGVVLMGLLPVYLAMALGAALVFDGQGGVDASFRFMVIQCGGYALPFVAGLAAPMSLLRTFRALAREKRLRDEPEDTDARPKASRDAWPVLFVGAWCTLFTAMAPLGAWRVLTALSGGG